MPVRYDTPAPAFAFRLKIISAEKGTAPADLLSGEWRFKQISGIRVQTDMTPHNEGGLRGYNRWIVGVDKWPNLSLKGGFLPDAALFLWLRKPMRVTGAISQLGAAGEELCKWTFTRGYPVKWELGAIDSTANEILLETLEIAHEGLTLGDPQPPEPPPEPPEEPPIEATVNFDFDQTDIKKMYYPELDAVAEKLKNDPEKKVTVKGHTDNVGSESYNQTLSEERARVVKDYLVDRGAPPGQVSSRGYGESEPIADNSTDAGRARNRRTEVKEDTPPA